MNHKIQSLALILSALTLSTIPACGDDESGGGGTGGTAGASAGSAGTSGVGGSSGTSGAGGSSGGGGSGATSGAAGSSGTGGVGGTGGGGAGGEGGMGMMNSQVCPATQPTNGETCMPGRGDCEFGDNLCDCVNDTDTWACWNPVTDCPEEAPANESACPLVGIECEYGQGQGGNECDCDEDGWECDDEGQGGDEDGGI